MIILAKVASLSLLESAMSVDNMIAINSIASRAPKDRRKFMRIVGIGFACIARLGLLCCVGLLSRYPPIRCAIGVAGGAYLVWHGIGALWPSRDTHAPPIGNAWASMALVSVALSVDSVLIAAHVAETTFQACIAVVVSSGVMLVGAGIVARIMQKYAAINVLALLAMIGIGASIFCESALFLA